MKILKELRERSGLTLRQVEEATLISNSYLSQLETGKIKKPSAQALYVLAKLYRVDIETLLLESGLINPTEIPQERLRPSIIERIEALEKKMEAAQFPHIVFGEGITI